MKLFFQILFLIGITFIGVQAKEDGGEDALITRALTLYRDMHAGRYTLKVKSSSVSNNQNILITEIKAAGMTFPGRMEIPIQEVNQDKNIFTVNAGLLFSAEYSRRIFGNFWLHAGAGWITEKPLLWGGIGYSW